MSTWDWLLRGWGGCAALTCAVLLPTACYRGQALELEHRYVVFTPGSRLLLIDDHYRPGFPDGAELPPPTVINVEPTGPRELWRTTVASTLIPPPSNARFAAVLSRFASPGMTRVGLLQLDSGKFRDLGVLAPDASGDRMIDVATALSDDGALFASVLDGQLRVWETASRRLAAEQSFDTRAQSVSFIEGGHDILATLAKTPDELQVTLVVLAQSPTGWHTEQTFDGVHAFGWTKRGLVYASALGVSRYNRHESQLLVAGMKLNAGSFSPDGRYVGYWAQGALNVYDFDARRVVLSSKWYPGITFHGNFVTAMSYDGKLWRGNLSTGTSKVLRDFGRPAETVKIILVGGTNVKVHYEYQLNADGTLLYYREPHDDARIYQIDQL